MASKCTKFLPNIFNKSKCQHCFAAKEAHSAEALENNKASRKMSKCGYLFVSPGLDFSNPLDRTRRWQRRFFVLYDDGELTYSVDENPDTIPQGTVDMNKCTDVSDAEKITTHSNSLCVFTPEKTVYIKGNSKEEIQWWHDILAEFPKALKAIKPRRKQPYLILSNKENLQPDFIDSGGGASESKLSRFDTKNRLDGPSYSTFRGVRSLKHKYDTNHQEGLRKSSSLHDLSTEESNLHGGLESSRFLSRSGDHLDILSRDSSFSIVSPRSYNPYFTIPRSTWTRTNQPVPSEFLPANYQASNVGAASVPPSSSSSTPVHRSSLDERSKSSSSRYHRERSASLKEFPSQFSMARDGGEDSAQHTLSADETDSNETDELKMARSSELNPSSRAMSFTQPSSVNPEISAGNKYEDLVYMKKGWLIKQASTEKESKKHWFVLAGNSLRYYKDAKAEEASLADGRIDLTSCFEVSEVPTHRNYGFKIKTRNGEYVLAAMTSGIRNNWMKAIRLCMELHDSEGKTSSSAGRVLSSRSPSRTLDDFEVKAGATASSTAAVTGASGETAFQLVGRRDPHKRDTQKPTRRHHSDVNPGNVSKVLSIKDFSVNSDRDKHKNHDKKDKSFHSKIPQQRHQESSQRRASMKRFVEGNDAGNDRPVSNSGTSKRSVTSESGKEEVKREMMRRAKSPSARVKQKSRVSRPSRLSSPTKVQEPLEAFHVNSAESDAGGPYNLATEEEYQAMEDTDHDEVGSATASDMVGEDNALVEILETEVESLKDRLQVTQTELDKVHKDNIDLKSRLQKDQTVESGYNPSGRYGKATSEQTVKRQLKESREVVQRQRLDMDNLKSKLDMSMSKLTGTEKALSEALRDYKQEKDKFLKMNSEWNRRLRDLESQSKENLHKLERSRENLQTKERECRRLEAEVKTHSQKSREHEREILKLKAVEHEYNQLKEKLDDREHEIISLRSDLKEKELISSKMKAEFERQLEEVDQEFGRERDDLENHLEQLKSQLYSAHDRQNSMSDDMTNSMADMIREKDDIISQLEEKMIESDKKLCELSEELHAEMAENADLAHSIEILEDNKSSLSSTIDRLESQLLAIKTKVSGFESENFSLKKQLEELRKVNLQLQETLRVNRLSGSTEEGASGQMERETLYKTINDLNKQIQDLQNQRDRGDGSNSMERANSAVSSISSVSTNDVDLLHSVLLADSQLKEVNSILSTLKQNFDAYLNSLKTEDKNDAISLGNLVEDIGNRCLEVQDTLRDSQGLSGLDEPEHTITVTSSSNSKTIMEEYKGLKVKFDQAVIELRKVKQELNSNLLSYSSLEAEDKKLKETIYLMEGAYKQQILELIGRVDGLSEHIVQVQTSSTPQIVSKSSSNVVQDIEMQLHQLEKRIFQLEEARKDSELSDESAADGAPSLPPSGSHGLVVKLEDIKSQLEDVNSKLESLDLSDHCNGNASNLIAKVKSYKSRINSLSNDFNSKDSLVGENSDTRMLGKDCLVEIKEMVKEIGGMLDLIDEDDEDSDSDEEDAKESTVEEIREKISGLTEFVESQSGLDSSDWIIKRLTSIQKQTLGCVTRDVECLSEEDKLRLYADRLSMEAVIISEMSHILDNKDYLNSGDCVVREMDYLNSQIMLLHQRLDNETKTMHFSEPQMDILKSYSDLMAEKILVNGELCSRTLDQKSHLVFSDSDEGNVSPSQPVILATEALLRSQIDSFICQNLDKSTDDILSLPTCLTSHSLTQGEVTYALLNLKSRLSKQPSVFESGSQTYSFMFERLLERQKNVMESVGCYEKQVIHSLAVIIWKESEEMTIVEGPESVLEAMCSELSTIMERHIQKFKEKCRTAADTHSAHKFDLIVNELRSNRETLLKELKLQHESYAKDPSSGRDSSLDVPVQSLDDTISNFGELLSLRSVVNASVDFLRELLKMGDSVLTDLEMGDDEELEDSVSTEKSLTNFINVLVETLQVESYSKENISRKILNSLSESQDCPVTETTSVVLRIPDLSSYPERLSSRAAQIVREATFSAQLTFSLFKMKLSHEREVKQLRGRRPIKAKPSGNADDETQSEENLELLDDFQDVLAPLEEVLESKHEDEMEVLQVLINQLNQVMQTLRESNVIESGGMVESQLEQLEEKLQHELDVAVQRHTTHLEVFKQESSKVEKTLEEQQQDRYHFEEQCGQLHEELSTLQVQHEEEKERMKQDILTAVHAIKSNDEKSESHLMEEASRLNKELTMQRLSFKKILASLKKEMASKDKSAITQSIEKQMAAIVDTTEDQTSTETEVEAIPALPTDPPPDLDTTDSAPKTPQVSHIELDLSHHEQEVEQLKKEKEEALAEEMRNTKAALDAMRNAYEEELSQEKSKYKEALLTMYTDEYVNEIKLRHQDEVTHLRDEVRNLDLHYTGKCEDYKLLEMKLGQIKQDYESHINQLIASNENLEEMLNKEMDSLKDFIKNKPRRESLTTGSTTMEEELYDAKIMIRVKDAELQKLRSQVKNLENSLYRTTEDQKQTMTQYMQALKTAGENKKQYTAEIAHLTEKLNKVVTGQGMKANIRRRFRMSSDATI